MSGDLALPLPFETEFYWQICVFGGSDSDRGYDLSSVSFRSVVCVTQNVNRHFGGLGGTDQSAELGGKNHRQRTRRFLRFSLFR